MDTWRKLADDCIYLLQDFQDEFEMTDEQFDAVEDMLLRQRCMERADVALILEDGAVVGFGDDIPNDEALYVAPVVENVA